MVISILEWCLKGYAFLLRGNNARSTGSIRVASAIRSVGTAILAVGVIDALGSIRTPVLAVGIPCGLGRIRIGAELAQIFLGLDVGTEEEHQKQKRL